MDGAIEAARRGYDINESRNGTITGSWRNACPNSHESAKPIIASPRFGGVRVDRWLGGAQPVQL
jgi:hypothetical protein